MTNPYHQYSDTPILDLADDSVIAHAIFPEFPERAAESAPESSRALRMGNPLGQEGEDALLNRLIELA